jgi:hypothetical protein
MNDELPVHWGFAFGQAVAGLRELVQAFNFTKLADGHTYVGVEPRHLVEVIDGFLAEKIIGAFGGNVTELGKLRKALVEQIAPTFENGVEAGKRRWEAGNCVCGEIEMEDLHRLALQLGPADPRLNGWFAEGFCVAYSHAELGLTTKLTVPPR